MELKVTNASELTSDLIHTYCDLTAWHHTLNLIFVILIFIDFAQLHFYLFHKNSHRVLIDCHASVIFQMVEDKTLINLIIEANWPNTSYFSIQNRFSNCSLHYDTPCICVVTTFSNFQATFRLISPEGFNSSVHGLYRVSTNDWYVFEKNIKNTKPWVILILLCVIY